MQSTMLILAGATRTQGPRCITQAKARGFRVIVADRRENLDQCPDVTAWADGVLALDYQNVDECVAWISANARSENITALYGFREYSVIALAEMAQAVGVPWNTPAATRLVRDKLQCRQVLHDHGFPQPLFMAADNSARVGEFLNKTDGPWVLKPRGASGSLGVSTLANRGEWEQFLDSHGLPQHYLVETFQPGQEFSVEGYFFAGQPRVLAVTRKFVKGHGNFVETGHAIPATLDPIVQSRISDRVTQALRVVGLTHGVFHAECWVWNDDVILGEIHARPGGDYIHLMLELVYGIELYGLVFDQFIDSADEWPFRPIQGAAIKYFEPPTGRLCSVSGYEELKNDPRVVVSDLRVAAGSAIPLPQASRERIGFVLAIAESGSDAYRIAQALAEKVEFNMCQEVGDQKL